MYIFREIKVLTKGGHPTDLCGVPRPSAYTFEKNWFHAQADVECGDYDHVILFQYLVQNNDSVLGAPAVAGDDLRKQFERRQKADAQRTRRRLRRPRSRWRGRGRVPSRSGR